MRAGRRRRLHQRHDAVRRAQSAGRRQEDAPACPGERSGTGGSGGLKESTCAAVSPPVTQIKFGTDGWRAVIAEDFTFANVARVAQAAADYWKSEHRGNQGHRGPDLKVIVGYDRRFLSDQFARTSAEVFAGNGFRVVLTPEPTPT